MDARDIAVIVHEANRNYCMAQGDFSQPEWTGLPPETQASAEDGVKYFMENEDVAPEEMWENWKAFKLSKGWIYGEVKNVWRKTHPNLVENYMDLPKEERMKDQLFMAICEVLQHAE